MLKNLLLFAVLTYASALYPPQPDSCAWGPSYWCSSLKVAKECHAFDHCITTVWLHQTLPKDDSDVCQFCENIVKDVKIFLDNKQTWEQVQQFLKSACQVLPSPDLVQLCDAAVNDSIQDIIKMIDQEVDPKMICASMGLCMGLEDKVYHVALEEPTAKLPVKVDEESACADCVKFFTDVKDIVSSPTGEKELEALIEMELCSQMGSLADTCKTLVESYVPEVIQLVESEIDPQTACQTLGFCNKTQAAHFFKKVLSKKMSVKVESKAGEMCTDCEKFFKDVQMVLASPAAQQAVIDLMENQVCPQLKSLSDTCKMFVKTYMPQLFKMLQSELTPDQICKSIGFCNSTKTSGITRVEKLKSQVRVQASAVCTDCEKFFNDVKLILTAKTTQQEVEDLINAELCSQMGQLADTCKLVVNTYMPQLFQMLQSDFDPAQICQLMGFCNSSAISSLNSKVEKSQVKLPKSGSSAQCVLCEFIMKELDGMLSQNKTETEIIAALEKVCHILPSTLEDECTSFVSVYGPAVIALLLQEIQPAQVCSTLGLCKSQLPLQKSAVKADEYCSVCKVAMQYLDSLISSQSTQKEIEEALDKVCNFLPASMSSECDDIVTQYTPILLQLLSQEATPQQICSYIGLCSNSTQPIHVTKQVPMLGESKCTWGPAYWCQSRENAKECSAEAHCEKHVWN